jgi:hypothetical protein
LNQQLPLMHRQPSTYRVHVYCSVQSAVPPQRDPGISTHFLLLHEATTTTSAAPNQKR